MKSLRILVLAFALMGLSASVSAAKIPIGTTDGCASVFTEDASACGGSGNTQIGCFSYWNGSAWTGYIQYRRYDGFVWSSWMTASYNFC